MALFEESEALGGGLAEIAGRLGQNASGFVGALALFFQHYGQAFFGLLGFSFGFWRWWRYRERILHDRLATYIAESDRRLDAAHANLLSAIQRPGPCLAFAPPLFADHELQSVLRETRWDRTPIALTVLRSADAQLASAIGRISSRLEAATSASASLKKQLVAAHTLRGAIAASEQKTPTQGEFALACFRNALRLPQHKACVFAKELEAHQLRRLGHFGRAGEAYGELLALTEHLDARQQAILNARAKRYLAEVTQAQKMLNYFSQTAASPASLDAIRLLTASGLSAQAPGALLLRSNFEPYREWDLLESGDVNFFASFAYAVFGGTAKAADYLEDAIAAYQGVLDDLFCHGWAYQSARKKLKIQAQNGLRRAKAARDGDYDIVFWLVPSLSVEQAQQITTRIRAYRGNQPVTETT